MTGARVFHGLLAVVVLAGVATTLMPAIKTAVAVSVLVAAVLAVAAAVTALVAAEVRWDRDMDRLIAEPLPLAAVREEVAR